MTMKLLSKKEMEKLTTQRLLAYKNKLMQIPPTDDWDDGSLNKTSAEWKGTYHTLKSILATRENIQ